MSDEAIMLAKTYKKHKDLLLPVTVTEKLDGVPGNFFVPRKSNSGDVLVKSRQNEEILSVPHIQKALKRALPKGAHVVGELYISGMDFKDISGIVRRQTPDEDTAKLRLYIFDYYVEGQEHVEFYHRMAECVDNLYFLTEGDDPLVRLIPGLYVDSVEVFDEAMAKFKKDRPDAEGVVIRALFGDKSGYKAGWRSPGMLKLKVTETIDLPIVSIEEAVDKDGALKGMVGRINVEYKGQTIGVGPGKMKHKDRIEVFQNKEAYTGKMIEIAYMPDDSYDALREPRFYRFRPDKD